MADRFADLAFRRLPLACLAAAAGAGAAFGPAWSATVAWAPWLVALAVVGLAHGATDLAVSRRLCRSGSLPGLWALYMALMVAVVAAYAVAPVTVIALFVLASGWHFGRAHAETERPGRPRTGLEAVCAAVARGGLTLGVPLAAQPGAASQVAADLLRLTGHAAIVDPFPLAAVRTFGLGLVAAGVVGIAGELVAFGTLPDGRRRGDRMLVELAVISMLGLATDPLFAVGVSFLVWHAWRQTEPLAEILTGTRPDSWRTLAQALVHIHLAALPLLLPAWLAIGLAWWFCSGTHALRDLAILSIGAYLVVTPAHEVLGDFLGHPPMEPAAPCPRRSASWSA